MQNVVAVVLGMMVAIGLVSVGDAMAGTLFTLPPGIDPSNKTAMAGALEAAIANAPVSAMLTIVAGYFVAAFGGGFIARKIAVTPSPWPSYTVGVLVFLATAANFASIKHPLFMVVLGLLVPLPGSWLGARLGRGGSRSTPAPTT